MKDLEDHDLLVSLNARVENLDKHVATLVTQLEFTPIKLLVYGGTGIVLSSIVAAVVAVVLKK